MSIAKKYEKENVRTFNVNTEGYEFKSLSDLVFDNGLDETYTVRGCYINKKSKYGESPVIITDSCFVNVPKHRLDDIKEILASDEDIEEINNGKCGFLIRDYEDKDGITRYTIKFIEL